MQRVNHLPRRVISIVLTIVMVASLFSGILPGLGVTAKAAANEIANDSLKISVGDLGQISMFLRRFQIGRSATAVFRSHLQDNPA